MLRIIIQEKGGARQELAVEKEEVSIGRVPANDLHLPKNNVSKKHAKIVKKDGGWDLVDLKSTNGTFVNGQPVTQHRLSPTDQVIVGDFLLQFEMGDGAGAGVPTPPPAPPAPPAPPPSLPPAPPGPPRTAAPVSFAPPGPPGPPPMSSFPPMGPSMSPGPTSSAPSFGPSMGPSMPPGPSGPPPFGPSMGPSMGPSVPAGPPGPPPPMGGFAPPGLGRPMGPPPTSSPLTPMGSPPTSPPMAPMLPTSPGMPPLPPDAGGRPPAPPPFGGKATGPMPPAFASASGGLPPAPPPVKPFDPPGMSPMGPPGPPMPPMGGPTGPSSTFQPTFGADKGPRASMSGATPFGGAPPLPPSFPKEPLAPPPAPPVAEPPSSAKVSAEEDFDAPSVPDLPSSSSFPQDEKTPIPIVDPDATPEPMDAVEVVPHEERKPAPPAPAISVLDPDGPEEYEEAKEDEESYAQAIASLHQRLRSALPEIGRLSAHVTDDLREKASSQAQKALQTLKSEGAIPADLDDDLVLQATLDEVLGLGPLAIPLSDDAVSAIFVNGKNRIDVEREGQILSTPYFFSSLDAIRFVVERMIASSGHRLSPHTHHFELRLEDGLWVHAIFPPLARRGTVLTLQKPSSSSLSWDDAQKKGLFNDAMGEFLELATLYRRNLLISGLPGSGRTSLLGLLASVLPDEERIASVERVGELKLPQRGWIALEAQPPQGSAPGVEVEDVLEQALRLRPNRLLLGDIEGREFSTLLPRLVAGMDGVLMSSRASSPQQALKRLETLALSYVPHTDAAAAQVSQAIQIVVQLTQFACGTRKITSIHEVSGFSGGQIQTAEIFRFQKEGTDINGKVQGRFLATGSVPSFVKELQGRGIDINPKLFK